MEANFRQTDWNRPLVLPEKIVAHLQHFLNINTIKAMFNTKVLVGHNTLESYEPRWPFSLNPNQDNSDNGVKARWPDIDCAPSDMLNTLTSSTCQYQSQTFS